jgi:acyl dehydratase
MPATQIDSISQLRELVGQEVAVSDWVEVTQARINQFAEATGDHQWIHLDAERAAKESPYGATIAHGFLTLSLLSFLMSQAIEIRQRPRMGINYGLNRVRFPAAVPAGALVRGRFTLQSLEDFPGGVQLTWGVVVECQGSDKPCCVAEWIGRRYE